MTIEGTCTATGTFDDVVAVAVGSIVFIKMGFPFFS